MNGVKMIDSDDMDMGSGIAAFETKSFAQAAILLGPFAQAGVPDAMYRMAIMTQNGLGMVENKLLAYKYMKGAAEAGMGLAQHGLGFMYMDGDCVEANGEKAVEWFTKAAEQGLIGSMTTLAMMYQDGKIVKADPEKASYWFKKAGFDEMA